MSAVSCIARTAVVVLAMGGCGARSVDTTDESSASVVAEARPGVPLVAGSPAWSDAWILAESSRYLDDPGFRREILERSLVNPENLYSHTRLSAYGHGDAGWDVLPEWVPQVRPVGPADAAALREGAAPSLNDATAVWDGARPSTWAGWVALGRRVFFEYPLRPEIFAEHALTRPEVALATGLAAASDGTWPGLVVFADLDRSARVGITCALCHTALDNGEIVEGRARRSFDYGELRLAFHRDTDTPLPADLAERMASWGPGRADITEDQDQDPVAIPDLWGVRQLSTLTAAGMIRHVHPAALAIRQETQILHANRERTRPPRELAWALAIYLYSLEPPPQDPSPPDPRTARGAQLFATHCGNCHDDAVLAGRPIPADRVGTDRTLAFSSERGTGRYRPSPLVRVADGAPYFHHGVVPSLDELLGEARFSPDYDRGTRGPGPIEGHRFGTDLAADDRGALVAYLRTL